MGIDITPDIALARRTVEKYGLAPPINIEKLIKRYAELVVTDFPFDGADGISLDLKIPGKMSRVIVNAANSRPRQLFTLAHELGHILIPWHIGTIIDHADPSLANASSDYWMMELEANAFAAEILMPNSWMNHAVSSTSNLARLHKSISTVCKTSTLASAIRLAHYLPENIVYAAKRYGAVEYSGRTAGTLASPLAWKIDFPADPYDYAEKHYTADFNGRRLHWWRLPASLHVESPDSRQWREILSQIIRDAGVAPAQEAKVKSSINGVAAYANSATKLRSNYSVDVLVSACMQRFNDRPKFDAYVRHQDFSVFVLRRAQELVRNSN